VQRIDRVVHPRKRKEDTYSMNVIKAVSIMLSVVVEYQEGADFIHQMATVTDLLTC
jgi:hypothetical protein